MRTPSTHADIENHSSPRVEIEHLLLDFGMRVLENVRTEYIRLRKCGVHRIMVKGRVCIREMGAGA